MLDKQIANQLWLASPKKANLKSIFTGKVKLPYTNQKVHKIGKNERESILCFLYNLVHEMDLRMSLNDLRTFISIYGNNLRTVVNEKKLFSKSQTMNESEKKLIQYFIEVIISKYFNNTTPMDGKRKQFEHLKEIRKWASMVYGTILHHALQTNPKHFKMIAYLDETSVVRIVVAEEVPNGGQGIPESGYKSIQMKFLLN